MAEQTGEAHTPSGGVWAVARCWLWRPANLAVGGFSAFLWADRLGELRSPSRPLPGWQEALLVGFVFAFAGIAWQYIGSALFAGWGRQAEPGAAVDPPKAAGR